VTSLHSLQLALRLEPSETDSEKLSPELFKTAEQQVLDWTVTSLRLATLCDTLVLEMDFGFLYDDRRDLFSIGYNVDRAEHDKSTYDLLASEARLASFIAIAKGDVPPKHWFHLQRRLTVVKNRKALVSWSGTVFEYLMPLLFMRRFAGTLLDETYETVVRWQRYYGEKRSHPWGYSESGYFTLSLEMDYQYRAFGAPGLGIKRGLAEDYVVAPYATMLALMVDLKAALKNLTHLQEEGAYGTMGFYEAIDYTRSRLQRDQKRGVVSTYMAHHQGMSLLALENVLSDNNIQRYFHAHPLVQSCALLLQERLPTVFTITELHPLEIELEPSEEHTVHYAVEHSTHEQLSEPVSHTLETRSDSRC